MMRFLITKKYYIFAALVGVLLGAVTLLAIHSGTSTVTRLIANKIVLAKAVPGGFQVSLSTNSEVPIKAGAPFTIKAKITMFNGQGVFEFIWWLPEEVNVISGEVDPTLVFNSNGEAEAEITLSLPYDNKNYQIDGEAYRIYEDSSVLGSIKQFNTNPELLSSATVKPILKRARVVQ
ncbi:MAG: hypothetical protein IPM57_03310 [Oligoflexia bacterium]|nr:hypothetical protein [Oligoflexia bacterium]